MSDETQSAPSLLDEDLTQVDTSMPCIRGNILHDFEIISVAEIPNKAGDGTNLEIKQKTTAETVSTKGESIAAGFPITQYIGLTPSDKYPKESIRKALATFVEAVEGVKNPINPTSRFAGKRVRCKVSVQQGDDKYPGESNRLRYVKA